MKPLSLTLAAEYARGRVARGTEQNILGVSTDSRAVKKGDLFIALIGENHDGPDHVAAAVRAGAVAVMAQKTVEVPAGIIHVRDTLEGLQRLAGAYRRSLLVRVVGVTGSSGKSSTKEMIASVLSRRFRTHKTLGNFNNHIGVPLTLLSLEPDHEWVVVEVGMNHPGEIKPLADLMQPEIGVVTNVDWTHAWAFEDQQAIADEKGAMLRALPALGISIINADDKKVREMVETSRARSVLVGQGADWVYGFENVQCCDEFVEFDLHTRKEKTRVKLSTPAPHMAQNAVLAAAVGGELGLSAKEIAEGLSATQFPPSRCALRRFGKGWLIDDTYNASPGPVMAGFDTLQALSGSGRSVVILGAMGELGSHSRRLHEKVGEAAAEKGVQLLFALGEDARCMVEAAQKRGLNEQQSRWFKSHEELAEAYVKVARPDDKILIKGSRSQHMEKIVQMLEGGATCSSI
ncbi:MAG: UDP-N-acetylmuramoyl-tripeptide--D-alanyl-D-alanine ligase [bacterium]